MSSKPNFLNLTLAEIEDVLAAWEEPRFRAKQVFLWVWKHGATEFSQMSNVSKKLREKLEETYAIRLPKIITAQKSEDGTIKHLLLLDDNKTVETVWIPRDDQDRVTICVSSQVGCKMGCTFCLTAQQKVERNLAAGEIAAQLLVMPDRSKITNVVLMGMGEPFDNYDAVMGALSIMNSPDAFYIGARKITVSTSGLVPKIRRFLTESKFKLAVSLNAPNDEIRSQIMPINKAYPLDDLLGTVREISRDWKHGLYITWEYILIKDLNDQPEHARELVKRLKGIPSKVNLLLYNENPNVPYKRPEMDSVERFREVLGSHGLLNFVRTSRGRDISAACGQLASEHIRSDGPTKTIKFPARESAAVAAAQS